MSAAVAVRNDQVSKHFLVETSLCLNAAATVTNTCVDAMQPMKMCPIRLLSCLCLWLTSVKSSRLRNAISKYFSAASVCLHIHRMWQDGVPVALTSYPPLYDVVWISGSTEMHVCLKGTAFYFLLCEYALATVRLFAARCFLISESSAALSEHWSRMIWESQERVDAVSIYTLNHVLRGVLDAARTLDHFRLVSWL